MPQDLVVVSEFGQLPKEKCQLKGQGIIFSFVVCFINSFPNLQDKIERV
jgi:hypothetical protein